MAEQPFWERCGVGSSPTIPTAIYLLTLKEVDGNGHQRADRSGDHRRQERSSDFSARGDRSQGRADRGRARQTRQGGLPGQVATATIDGRLGLTAPREHRYAPFLSVTQYA